MRQIRVLVVDDSVTMRRLISMVLRRDREIDVVGEAGDPFEARQAIKALNPDVVTLDVEMPNMNGLDFLEKIMRLRPTPVIMVSNLTAQGTAATIKALEIGAFDCIAKPVSGEVDLFGELASKVKAAAGATMRQRPQSEPLSRPESFAATREIYHPGGRLVAIGSSTGGVEALITILSGFPQNCPPTVIAQHMPAGFTRSFAERLNRLCQPQVCEASDGALLEMGRVYLAPGGLCHLEISGTSLYGSTPWRCRLRPTDPVNGHRPSVDVLFASVAKAAGSNSVGVILTGMGRDGAQGLLAMRQSGARTFGQDEASSLVYGMPKAAYEIGAVERQVALPRLRAEILRATNLEGEEKCLSPLQ
ncbi:protein-glutamate methylesterase/protein-glutamine glutaminase [Beijerinckia indica]|uniref:Protein-glutamate methylesterase/protein-glutamine glutaminase n=1 Tax=Beijerinckia indica subsp. indica (strain ATCC 9039 / DSM 1715 / NCIMB 8712) TaxID=395963 RepID=B2IGA5_BEII9|nr:chemotaxis response regulator protein-glutamate methylesterase [Beijerinckia indica]ACB97179.1 response regulator receiver modulated CheB methylesterase [Beijerinckia indica subsp. indica ATCC 9039]